MVFNSEYFINQILEQINCKTSEERETVGQKLILHFDNARPHTSKKVMDYLKENSMIRAPQPPYSPDIAPSDFYLFGYIKDQLKGCIFNSKEDLLSAIRSILETISTETLKKVFLKWEERLKKVIDSNGDYFE